MTSSFHSRPVRTLRFIGLLAALVVSFTPRVFFAQALPTEGSTIELPTFTVQDSPFLPEPESWRYARIEGFEILSNTSDSTASRLVRDFQRFHQALVLAWPPADIRSAVPAALILCGKGAKFDAFKPKKDAGPDSGLITLNFREAEAAAIVVDLEATSLNLITSESLDMMAAASAAAASLEEEPGESITSGIPTFVVDHYQQLYREYIRFVLAQVHPRSPAWFEEGLSQIFMRMEFSPTIITVGKVEDPNRGSIGKDTVEDRDFNVALRRRALMPLEKLFAVPHGSPMALHPLGSLWAKESYAFVHMCLYGHKGKLQEPLITFLNRLAKTPPNEALFKECFGKTYKEMQMEIRLYSEYTAYQTYQIKTKKGTRFPEPAKPQFREATQAEIGRIKGETLRLAGNPTLARATLLAPYIRGERDPQLLAAIGLNERSAGEDARARKFLEAAAKGGVTRPRAHLELARLRFADAAAAPAGPRGRFSEKQVQGILTPLFTARAQPPPLPEVYETIAATWSRSSVAPTAANLEVLDEGVRLFFRRSDWIYQAAQVKALYGFTREAAKLADIGLKFTEDPAKRQQFEQFKASLPPDSE